MQRRSFLKALFGGVAAAPVAAIASALPAPLASAGYVHGVAGSNLPLAGELMLGESIGVERICAGTISATKIDVSGIGAYDALLPRIYGRVVLDHPTFEEPVVIHGHD